MFELKRRGNTCHYIILLKSLFNQLVEPVMRATHRFVDSFHWYSFSLFRFKQINLVHRMAFFSRCLADYTAFNKCSGRSHIAKHALLPLKFYVIITVCMNDLPNWKYCRFYCVFQSLVWADCFFSPSNGKKAIFPIIHK